MQTHICILKLNTIFIIKILIINQIIKKIACNICIHMNTLKLNTIYHKNINNLLIFLSKRNYSHVKILTQI